MNEESLQSAVTKKSPEEKRKQHWRLKNLPRSFVVRATDAEHQKLKKMAKQVGLSLSRLVIEGTLAKTIRTAGQMSDDRVVVEELIFELKRIGINLSQLNAALYAARRGNKTTTIEMRLEELISAVEDTLNKARKNL